MNGSHLRSDFLQHYGNLEFTIMIIGDSDFILLSSHRRAVGQLALVSTIVVVQLTRGGRWTTSCYHFTLAGIWILTTIPSNLSLNTPHPVHQPLDNKRNNAVNSHGRHSQLGLTT